MPSIRRRGGRGVVLRLFYGCFKMHTCPAITVSRNRHMGCDRGPPSSPPGGGEGVPAPHLHRQEIPDAGSGGGSSCVAHDGLPSDSVVNYNRYTQYAHTLFSFHGHRGPPGPNDPCVFGLCCAWLLGCVVHGCWVVLCMVVVLCCAWLLCCVVHGCCCAWA